MRYKKQLRVSSDYIAVDLVNEQNTIVETSLYLTINKPQKLHWYDREIGDFITAIVTYNGKELICKDSDSFSWTSPINELLTEAIK